MHTSQQSHLNQWRSVRSASAVGARMREHLRIGTRPCHYVRTHVPTGTTYAANFNGTQAPQWGDGDWQHTSTAVLMRIGAELVARWNSGPERTLWTYELHEGDAP